MDERLIWYSLMTTPGIGQKRYQRVQQHFSTTQNLLDSNANDWKLHVELNETFYRAWRKRLQAADLAQEWQQANTADRFVLMSTDEAYPELLKQITDPPPFLFCRGRREVLDEPTIAMVGTRSCTTYGKAATVQLSRELVQAGWCVVSGLARGVDYHAHESTLQAGGSTIAVLAAGVEQIYPQEHADLAKRIAAQGLLVSEHPPRTRLTTGLFPQRNRIIAGISYGTIVVEAGERSGALITTALAAQYAREVFAVPGAITSPKSVGPLALLADGAKLVRNAQDVQSELKYVRLQPRYETGGPSGSRNQAKLTPEEAKVYAAFPQYPTHFEELRELTKYELGQLHMVLLSLQMKKCIKQIGPMQFLRIE